MFEGFGVVGLVAAIVVAIAVCIGAVFLFRQRRSRRSDTDQRGKSAFPNQSRLEVLDTTEVDEERRLILVRCDGIEHLIMTGGPSDVVVENDVRRARGSGAAGDKATASAARDRSTGALTSTPATARPRPADNVRAESATTPSAPVPAAASPRPVVRPAPQPMQAETDRRDSASQWRNPQRQPTPVAANQPVETRRSPAKPQGGDRPADPPRPNREAAAVLPGATTPWPEPDSIESEIVEALRFERKPDTGASASPGRETASRERKDSAATTLGDLAERLEEALAREVQSTNQALGLETDRALPAPSGKPDSAAAESRRRPEPKLRAEPKERAEAPKPLAAVPEPEARREPAHSPERREEAPVISLNSRRREAIDPLEDEMARLLGELTGDTKGR